MWQYVWHFSKCLTRIEKTVNRRHNAETHYADGMMDSFRRMPFRDSHRRRPLRDFHRIRPLRGFLRRRALLVLLWTLNDSDHVWCWLMTELFCCFRRSFKYLSSSRSRRCFSDWNLLGSGGRDCHLCLARHWYRLDQGGGSSAQEEYSCSEGKCLDTLAPHCTSVTNPVAP